jgi:hypothetical protein
VRNGESSFTKAVKQSKLSKKEILQYVGSAFRKKGRVWVASKTDNLQRPMLIFSNGKRKSIIVKDSKNASIIGNYFDAIGRYREHNDITKLKKFEGVKVYDKNGNSYILETDINEIIKIYERIEDVEFFEIYDDKY